jgi:4-amino-4-deoxy-L-arabinose transferase-like glycosyltransferase
MLVLALCFKLFGAGVTEARWISVAVASTSAPLMFLLCRRFASRGAAIVAGIGCALYPTWVHQSLFILSEAYFVPVMLLAMLLTARAYASRGAGAALLAGCAWGVAALVRPHGLIIGVLLAAWFARRLRWKTGVMLAAGTFACILPWFVRNVAVMGHPILLATEGGETLLGSNNRYVLDDVSQHGMWLSPMKIPEYREHLRPIRDEVQRNAEQNAMAKAFLRQNPGAIPRLAAYKLWRWLTPVTVTGGVVRILVLLSYGSLLVLLGVGAIRLNVVRPSILLHQALICTAVFFLITAVYWGGLTRGRIPLEIVWLPWGAMTAWELWRRIYSHRRATHPQASP